MNTCRHLADNVCCQAHNPVTYLLNDNARRKLIIDVVVACHSNIDIVSMCRKIRLNSDVKTESGAQ